MMNRLLRHTVPSIIVALIVPVIADAEVSRVEIVSRKDVQGGRVFGPTGPYEQITVRLHFLVDPTNRRNQVIADLDKAPRNSAGKIEVWSDAVILKPRDSAKANGIALIDVPNRGRCVAFRKFHGPGEATCGDGPDGFGDGFLMNQGFTIVEIGWEFDQPRGVSRAAANTTGIVELAQPEGGISITVPRATGITGLVRATFSPVSKRADMTVSDLAGYTPSNPDAAENTLTVRDTPQSVPATIPRTRWRVSAKNVVTLDGGFESGRVYELSYLAKDSPIAGLGFAAVRDAAAWVKYAPDALVSAKYTLAFGSSQTGRFLREFLYSGFYTDERNRLALDAVWPHVSGAQKVNLNRRWSIPVSASSPCCQVDVGTFFPFSSVKQRDPVTGVEEGLLENGRAGGRLPKVIWTLSATEYYEKSGALLTTTPNGTRDITLLSNERVYNFAGIQHDPSEFPSAVTNGQLQNNPTEYKWAMRALLVAMEKWLRDSVEPPASRYPRLQDGTLVPVTQLAFPAIPGVPSPKNIIPGPRGVNSFISKDGGAGAPIPLLVSQVDKDGNELGGLRMPEVAVPLATTTGWNFRNSKIGGTQMLFLVLGSHVPFANTRAERERTHDPRLSIEERYSSRDDFLTRIRESAASLVKEGYLLVDDVPAIVKRASSHWDLLVKRGSSNTASAER